MQRRRPLNTGVFFTGVPLTVEKSKLRQHFESVGHVVDFRLFDPAPGKDFRHGLADYMDDRTAAEAISRLNGITFGERAIRVTMATTRSGTGGGGGCKRRRDAQGGGRVEAEGRGGIMFPRGFVDPVLGREESLVLDCLRGLSTTDAYEAVEQLRVLAIERRKDAKALLDENAALRSAVVMILQHAGRLPTGSLPAEAYQVTTAATASSAEETRRSEWSSSDAKLVKPTTEEQRDEVMHLISNLSEADVERILTMSAADLQQVPDLPQRRQLQVLRDRLLEMSSDL